MRFYLGNETISRSEVHCAFLTTENSKVYVVIVVKVVQVFLAHPKSLLISSPNIHKNGFFDYFGVDFFWTLKTGVWRTLPIKKELWCLPIRRLGKRDIELLLGLGELLCCTGVAQQSSWSCLRSIAPSSTPTTTSSTGWSIVLIEPVLLHKIARWPKLVGLASIFGDSGKGLSGVAFFSSVGKLSTVGHG